MIKEETNDLVKIAEKHAKEHAELVCEILVNRSASQGDKPPVSL